ncbi:MAG: hypothetical protein KME32_33535 [Mojavia pulchra JT2-VF2]|uniref:Ribbon-helix-helix protein CopG domain-containing protein n=1 Tax=Mojavia pulchra JT2-VF2 TaxID=287848 RepID=A0A951Q884_9NOST|nr:hypothetical protein [Mojavia pulchra JT2-VF2]
MTNERGKRGREDYTQISGYIPKRLAKAFRIARAAREITQSEALEEIIQEWVKRNLPANFEWDREEERDT